MLRKKFPRSKKPAKSPLTSKSSLSKKNINFRNRAQSNPSITLSSKLLFPLISTSAMNVKAREMCYKAHMPNCAQSAKEKEN